MVAVAATHQTFGEIVRSSPAVGDIDGDGAPEIVVGTGNASRSASDSNKLIALNRNGSQKWKIDLGAQKAPAAPNADTTEAASVPLRAFLCHSSGDNGVP